MDTPLPDPRSITIAIRKVREGDPSAFKVLMGAYHNEVARLARHLLGQEKQSNLWGGEDVAQSVFLRLWEGLAGGKTWFVTAVTDRDTLFEVLERMTWLRALNTLRHARAARRRKTVRDGDAMITTGENLSAALPDMRADNAPDLATVARLTIEEMEERLRRASKSEEQANQLVTCFRDLLAGSCLAETAAKLNLGERSVQRKRELIRNLLRDWSEAELVRLEREGDTFSEESEVS